VRKHRTTGERPLERFTREEQAILLPLAARPYQSLILQPRTQPQSTTVIPLPRIQVEKRPLEIYAAIAAGAR
jgi:hypothetical protein